jgi:phage tail-like protein
MATTITQTNSLANIQSDPLRNFKFHVVVHNADNTIMKSGNPKAQMGFMSVSGLSVTTDVVVYRQGGMNTTTQKMPGQSDFAPITLSRGLICGDANIYEWLKQVFVVIQGTGSQTGLYDFRKMIDIYLIDHPVTSPTATYKAGWRIHNAWITSCAFGDLDAGANGVELQQITLAHEGWEFKIADQYGPLQGVSFD